MKVNKIFITTYSEKKWLDKMADDGYELIKHQGILYEFEKTDKRIFYQHIFLKKGRKSYLELDYKKKDKDAKAIYGNGFVALFRRYKESPKILSSDELRLNYLKHKQKRTTSYLCFFMSSLCCAMVARYLWPVWIATVFCLIMGFVYLADTMGVDKLIKDFVAE